MKPLILISNDDGVEARGLRVLADVAHEFADVVVMAVFGFLGYYMRKFDFPTAPVVLGLLLGSMAEQGLLRSFIMAKDVPLLLYYVKRPICLVLLALIVLSVFAPMLMNVINKKMAKPDAAETGADANSDD